MNCCRNHSSPGSRTAATKRIRCAFDYVVAAAAVGVEQFGAKPWQWPPALASVEWTEAAGNKESFASLRKDEQMTIEATPRPTSSLIQSDLSVDDGADC